MIGATGLLVTIVSAVLVTFLRIWFLMLVSVLLALVLGILAARVRAAGAIIIPITNVLQAVPVISFFPIILVFFIVRIGGSLGVELATDFLIVTALIWNLILGVYEAIIHIPEQYHEVSKVFGIGLVNKLSNLYLPASFPMIVSNIMPSFASGLFYVTLSEVISVGSRSFSVFGVGSIAIEFANSLNYSGIYLLILTLIIGIALNFYLIINPLINRAERYSFQLESMEAPRARRRESNVFVSAMSQRVTGILSTGRSTIASLNRILPGAARRDHEKARGKIRISDRAINVIVGTILLLLIGLSIYFIAQSGFREAFGTYLTKLEFLKKMIFGTLYDLLRIAIVYLLSLATMVPLAIALGRRKVSGRFTTGIFQIIYSIPAPILFPLIVLFLTPSLSGVTGYGIAFNINVIIITFLSAAAYIFFNVYGAVLSIPAELKVISKTFKLSWWMEMRNLVIPAIIPALITGSMAAFGSYWGGLMVAEFAIIGGKQYSVSNGLMLYIDQAIYGGNLILADAIDMFMVVVIVLISYLLWMRLYSYSKKRFTL